MKPQQLHFFGIKTGTEKKIQKEGVLLSADIIVLMLVVNVLLLALSFSWGVNRGRHLTLKNLSSIENLHQSETLKPKDVDNNLMVKVPEAITPSQKPKVEITEKANNPTDHDLTDSNLQKEKTLYKIQVASFRTNNSAKKEAQRLKNQGFPVIIGQRGNHSVVYVGNFENKNDAYSTFEKLKTTYQDCILRRL